MQSSRHRAGRRHEHLPAQFQAVACAAHAASASSTTLALYYAASAAEMSYLPLTAAYMLDPLSATTAPSSPIYTRRPPRAGIDYASLGQGWDHPMLASRTAPHRATVSPPQRQQASHAAPRRRRKSLGGKSAEEAAQALIAAFCVEIGAPALAPNATWEGVKAAVDGELLNPLRSSRASSR